MNPVTSSLQTRPVCEGNAKAIFRKMVVFVDTCYLVNNMKAGRTLLDSLNSLSRNEAVDAVVLTSAVLAEVASVICRHRVQQEISQYGIETSLELATIENLKHNSTLRKSLKVDLWEVDGRENLSEYEELMKRASVKDNSRVGLGEASLLDVAQLYMTDERYAGHEFNILSVDSDVHVLLSYFQFNADSCAEVA